MDCRKKSQESCQLNHTTGCARMEIYKDFFFTDAADACLRDLTV